MRKFGVAAVLSVAIISPANAAACPSGSGGYKDGTDRHYTHHLFGRQVRDVSSRLQAIGMERGAEQNVLRPALSRWTFEIVECG
jgi:hypothetical protein